MKKKKVCANLLTNICLKFQVDILKTVDVVNATDQPTNQPTNQPPDRMMTPIYPPNFVCGGIKRHRPNWRDIFALLFTPLMSTDNSLFESRGVKYTET
jgi:hypothetical protein